MPQDGAAAVADEGRGASERVESGESPTFREDKFPFLFWFPHRRAHYLTEKVRR